LALLFIGCTQPNPTVPPIGDEIVSAETKYSKIKEDINNMLIVFYGRPISIFIAEITNKTKESADLPTNISDIVETSFNEIGEHVNVIADYNKIGEKQVYIIHGAITEYDVIEERNNGRNIDVEAGKGKGEWIVDGGLDRESKITKLAINFNPENMVTGSFVSKSSTANKITIYQNSSASDFGFSIFGSGFGKNESITRSQGIHSSITVLVDLSVAEVLGKLANFPYWLLTKGKVNRTVLNRLTDRFLDDKLHQKLYKVSYLLSLEDSQVEATRVMTKSLENAIKRYKLAHGMRANLYLSQQFYRSLLGG